MTFSKLHNDSRFEKEEKDFIGRMYEIFFQIPGFLKSEHERTDAIPTLRRIADHFEVTDNSIDLLLTVMAADRRVPSFFVRRPHHQRDPLTPADPDRPLAVLLPGRM